MKRLKVKGMNKLGSPSVPLSVPPDLIITPVHPHAECYDQEIVADSHIGEARLFHTTNVTSQVDSAVQSCKVKSPSDIELFDDETLASVLCGTVHNTTGVDALAPEGDTLLFEEMKFFVVEEDTSDTYQHGEDDRLPPLRMSIQSNFGPVRHRLSFVATCSHLIHGRAIDIGLHDEDIFSPLV